MVVLRQFRWKALRLIPCVFLKGQSISYYKNVVVTEATARPGLKVLVNAAVAYFAPELLPILKPVMTPTLLTTPKWINKFRSNIPLYIPLTIITVFFLLEYFSVRPFYKNGSPS